METALVSLFTVVMLVVTMLTMVMTTLGSVNAIADSFQAMEKQAASIQLTGIDAHHREFRGDTIVLEIDNIGQTNLGNYESWNVLVQLESGQITSLIFAESAGAMGDNQWAVDGFWMASGQPEVFDPKILNPDEEMTILLVLMPPLGSLQSARIMVATPNGVTAQTQVTAP
jgi:hypothetical protein